MKMANVPMETLVENMIGHAVEAAEALGIRMTIIEQDW